MITREADYAVRCILSLSEDTSEVMSVRRIAKDMKIPNTFLAKILQRLVAAGIVESVRGAAGGFRLMKNPAEISLLEVVEAIDGPVTLNQCAVDEDACERTPICVVHPIWKQVRRDLEKTLGRYNFKKLADANRKRGKKK